MSKLLVILSDILFFLLLIVIAVIVFVSVIAWRSPVEVARRGVFDFVLNGLFAYQMPGDYDEVHFTQSHPLNDWHDPSQFSSESMICHIRGIYEREEIENDGFMPLSWAGYVGDKVIVDERGDIIVAPASFDPVNGTYVVNDIYRCFN